MSAVNIDNTEAPESLSHCPFCRYDLKGLPRNYRCPECGFEYDESMQAWGHRLSPLQYWVSYFMDGPATLGEALTRIIGVILLLPLCSPSFLTRSPITSLISCSMGFILLLLSIRMGSQNRIIIAYKTGITVSNRKIAKRLLWQTFWVPNPDNPKEMPPWAERWSKKIGKQKGFIRSLFSFRPGFDSKKAAIYELADTKLWHTNDPFRKMVSLQHVGNRKTRKAMMHELRRRWEEANASDDVVDDQSLHKQ